MQRPPFSFRDPIPPVSQSNSASLAHAERRIQALEKENGELKKELQTTKIAYKQITTESTHENFDERRVNLLKSQLIQLERQVLLLNESLGSRAGTLLEVENALGAISDIARQYVDKDGKIGEVNVSREDIQRILQNAESSRTRLYRNIEVTSDDQLLRPIQYLEHFLKSTHSVTEAPTLLDICSGSLQHLNLKHVAKLESKLAQLYKQLSSLEKCLLTIVSNEDPKQNTQLDTTANDILAQPAKSANQNAVPGRGTNQHLPSAVYLRLAGRAAKSLTALQDVCPALLELSVLVPAAPWPVLQRRALGEVTVDAVMARLPSLPRAKQQEVKVTITALLQATNYSSHMAGLQRRALEEEVAFHQTVYQLQAEYMDAAFRALRNGYQEFEDSTHQLLCLPLQDILNNFSSLQETASEKDLRKFLAIFKKHADKLEETVEKLNPKSKDNEDRGEALSNFGDEFFISLQQKEIAAKKRRDDQLMELEAVRINHQENVAELRYFLGTEEPKEKKSPDKESGSGSASSGSASSRSAVSPHPLNARSESRSGKTSVMRGKISPFQDEANGDIGSGLDKRPSSACTCGVKPAIDVAPTKKNGYEGVHKPISSLSPIPSTVCTPDGLLDSPDSEVFESVNREKGRQKVSYSQTKKSYTERNSSEKEGTDGGGAVQGRPPRKMKGVAQSCLSFHPPWDSSSVDPVDDLIPGAALITPDTPPETREGRPKLSGMGSIRKHGSISSLLGENENSDPNTSIPDVAQSALKKRSDSMSRIAQKTSLGPLTTPNHFGFQRKSTQSSLPSWK